MHSRIFQIGTQPIFDYVEDENAGFSSELAFVLFTELKNSQNIYKVIYDNGITRSEDLEVYLKTQSEILTQIYPRSDSFISRFVKAALKEVNFTEIANVFMNGYFGKCPYVLVRSFATKNGRKVHIDAPDIGRIHSDGTIERGVSEQGSIFKSERNFRSGKGVCYVPELSDTKYTRQDFLNICQNDSDLAEKLFSYVDWQAPETALDEFEREEELPF